MDTQEICDLGWGMGESEEEGKSRRKKNDKKYLKFIKIFRGEYAQRLCQALRTQNNFDLITTF